jgi:hypothetical protein
MFNHQYNFQIEIPQEVITSEIHDHIFEELLENKVLIGLCGYGKSGKDTIAKKFIDDYEFHRVAFADNIKIEMNKYLKSTIFDYLQKSPDRPNSHPDIKDGIWLDDGRELTMEMMDFQTEDQPVKRRLRPFIIWYGEKLREINGPYYWINQAFAIDAKGHNKIILSDVRRAKELDVFESSAALKNRRTNIFVQAGAANEIPELKSNSYSSLLFHVSQLGLQDSDALTHECIRIAQEKWLFDYTFFLDPEIPEGKDYRSRAMNHQIKEVVSKFGISKPDKSLNFPGKQTSILD